MIIIKILSLNPNKNTNILIKKKQIYQWKAILHKNILKMLFY